MLALLLACLDGIPSERLTLTLGYAGLLEAVVASVAPSLGTPEELLRMARERRVTAVGRALVASGAEPCAAGEIARALLTGFDTASSLFRGAALDETPDSKPMIFSVDQLALKF
jgi:ATP phosphoribosyltransferase regulatory subunit HisZ